MCNTTLCKRKISILLAALMAACTVSACGAQEAVQKAEELTEKVEQAAEDLKEIDAKEVQEEVEKKVKKELGAMFSSGATIEETTLIDEQNVLVKATSLEYNNRGAVLKLYIENNSDKELDFYCGGTNMSMNAINGCAGSFGRLHETVSAGMKANAELPLGADELQILGITDIAVMNLSFCIEDADRNAYLPEAHVTLPTSIADSYDPSGDLIRDALEDDVLEAFDAEILYKNMDLTAADSTAKATAAVMATRKDGEKVMLVEVENLSDESIYLGSRDVSINGVMLSSNWDTYGMPAKSKALIDFRIGGLIDEAEACLVNGDAIGTFAFRLSEIDMTSHDEFASLPVEFVVDGSIGEAQIGGQVLFEENGLKIAAQEMTEDAYDYILPIVISNQSGEKHHVDVDYQTCAVNGMMAEAMCFGEKVEDGETAILALKLDKTKGAENGIHGTADFKEMQFTLELDSYSKNEKKETIKLTF